MIVRFPHNATVTIETPGSGPFPQPTLTAIDLKGRYEPSPANANLNYSAKFYCDRVENPEQLSGEKLTVSELGITIGISTAFNYQTHCEIWLD